MEDLRVAIAGLGTVGQGTVKILQQNKDLLTMRAGRTMTITAVSARNKTKDRGLDLDGIAWCDNPVDLADRDDVDVVVELIGGSDGPALELVEKALQNGKQVVTANKALIAIHGEKLSALSASNDAALAYEAGVAGGIPIIKALRESLAANRFSRVYGILNGTCNYILTEMSQTGADFAPVLKDAQDLGYAEADPTFDVDGIDAAHKLAILTSICFGTKVDFDAVHVEGIRNVSATDLAFAEELGYVIKLLGIATQTENGIEQRVHAVMVDAKSAIAQVNGVTNAVVAEGDFVGQTVFQGPGAGEGATASAVVGDLIDIASGRQSACFGVPDAALQPLQVASMEDHAGEYYVRLHVKDIPGVMAEITGALAAEDISIEALVQRVRAENQESVPVVMITHEVAEAALKRALARIEAADSVTEPAHFIRIERL